MLDSGSRYGVEISRAPKAEIWGLNIGYLFDPSGVLWHIAEISESN
jgi:uncharacterized glyoxalase superfamily protein PhnB